MTKAKKILAMCGVRMAALYLKNRGYTAEQAVTILLRNNVPNIGNLCKAFDKAMQHRQYNRAQTILNTLRTCLSEATYGI